ncbi:terminase large subunit [Escherichia coli]|nr:terminase family protein [Escherichia coli]MCN8204092.1 terminase large subunit [Escherichia coli]HAI3384514.1 hypothetical protein [Escherichia coli]HAL0004652.1 hypothetical protein [Escherichia coli]HAP1523994.1 hypothetical protein [Escherichia coli]
MESNFKLIRDLSVAELTDLIMGYPEEQRPDVIKAILDVNEYEKTHKLEYFEPFPYQETFINKNADHNYRFLMAANRIGKTFCGASEMAMHLTGRYPDWYKGRRIEGSGRLYWCIGPNLKMVKEIQQKELIGTDDCRTDELGTGAIPLDCIVTEKSKGWQSDGALLESVRIKHVDGGTNTLKFMGGTDPKSLEGRKVCFVWIDEEGDYSDEIYGQCIARTANGIGIGENGLIMITATPIHGTTPLTQQFIENKTGKLFMQNVQWTDCPMFSPEQVKEMIDALPPWEREMRSKGIPFVGAGAVFEVSDDVIKVDDLDIVPLPHWRCIAGIDFGHVEDPTVIVIALYDPDNEKYYIYREFLLNESQEERSASGVARTLKNSPFRNIAIRVPHDAGLYSDAQEANGKLLIEYGLNVIRDPFRNPTDLDLGIRYNDKGGSPRKIEPGLAKMRDLMRKEKLKVSNVCDGWLREKRTYSYKFNPKSQKLDYSKPDHTIDASRYAVMSLVDGKGCLWSELQQDSGTALKTYNTINL